MNDAATPIVLELDRAYEVGGADRTVDPPRTLAFTWGWATDAEPARTPAGTG